MTLPYDISRCLGKSGPCKHPAQPLKERLLDQCKSCKRHTSPCGERTPMMAPPYFVGEVCPERIPE